MNNQPNMLQAAQWYARRLGWFVFPCHEPVFKGGECVGCTCESYRRSEKCRQDNPQRYLPHDKSCASKGKCPRVKWSEESTVDLDQIVRWWRVWPTANIGIDCGKSNLLVFDADTYKDVYDGSTDVIGEYDEETVTVLTGGGGTHLFYNREGKPYGNSTRGLPPGIDIRGQGGYVVVAPSLHESGKRYQYENDYEPHVRPLLPIPKGLDAILRKCSSMGRAYTHSDIVIDDVKLQHAQRYVEKVLRIAEIDHFGAKTYGHGLKWILQHCPFQPEDDPHAFDASAFVAVLDDGRIVAGCHHNRCRKQIEEMQVGGWKLITIAAAYGAEVAI